jgi:hypothetical protein
MDSLSINALRLYIITQTQIPVEYHDYTISIQWLSVMLYDIDGQVDVAWLYKHVFKYKKRATFRIIIERIALYR